MNVRPRLLYILIGILMAYAVAAEPDSLSYPELMRSNMDEFSNDAGSVSQRISFEDQVSLQTKAQLIYKGFTFNYKNKGDARDEINQQTSLEYSWNGLTVGHGNGYINVAHGLILGYAMMKYSPAFSGQAGIRSAKFKIGTYDQYKDLTTLRVTLGSAGLSLFRYDGDYGAVFECGLGDWRMGLGVYGADKMLMESWASFQARAINASLDLSLSTQGINHFSSDLLYKKGSMRLYGSAVWLSSEFHCVKKDSKWGSGLSPGSQGLAAGIRINRFPWLFSGIAQSVLGSVYREERCMLECRFRQKPFEISGLYSLNSKNELGDSKDFPFGLTWCQSIKHTLKLNMKIIVTKTFGLVCHIQGDLVHSNSYVFVSRLEYKTKQSSLKFQLTRCNGFDHDLYFVRPAGPDYYGIRKAPGNETVYLDLVCSRNLDRFEIYVHVRNEGVSLGLNYK